jgi:hypothetical protein
MNSFGDSFLENLKSVLERLVNRDLRIKLFPAGFWVVNDQIEHLEQFGEIEKGAS